MYRSRDWRFPSIAKVSDSSAVHDAIESTTGFQAARPMAVCEVSTVAGAVCYRTLKRTQIETLTRRNREEAAVEIEVELAEIVARALQTGQEKASEVGLAGDFEPDGRERASGEGGSSEDGL